MPHTFRHATCNEAFKDWEFAEECRAIRRIGYTGIEIAPFTLAEDAATITPGQRREYRSMIGDAGLSFVGLHWLMVSPPGLHITTPDKAVRERSWQHIRTLIDLCADLGPGGVMVFGSPQQRSSTGGLRARDATRNYIEGLASVASQAEERGVTILIEPLSPAQTDVVTTLDEAAAYVDQIGSPAIQTMFDTHNAVDEREPHALLVERHSSKIRHVHVNEMDGKHCGTGDYDFKPVLSTLKRLDYKGWISLEAFDFSYGAERLATESLRYLEKEIERI
ncbi:MAG TPA: sugar phosphate isomerase/epimerase family protein [Bryobacteraceae bacterium]|nr:sugar phosphate isomerase/epimerase family protein [Bryobacteraceae bacterium]